MIGRLRLIVVAILRRLILRLVRLYVKLGGDGAYLSIAGLIDGHRVVVIQPRRR